MPAQDHKTTQYTTVELHTMIRSLIRQRLAARTITKIIKKRGDQ